MVLVGDVRDRVAIIVDDMADTCGTLVKAAEVVMEHGARECIAIVTHGILSGNACEKLNGSKLKKLVVTNTVPHEEKKKLCDRIETIDISPTVSATVCLCGRGESLTFGNSWPRRAEERTMARACLSYSNMLLWTRFVIARPSMISRYPDHFSFWAWVSSIFVKSCLDAFHPASDSQAS